MKISKKNLELIENVPTELTIKTACLKQALEEYPKDGGVLLESNKRVVMKTPAKGRVLCNVRLVISVQKQLE